MSYTNWMENQIQNHVFGKAVYAATVMYVGLCKANPGEGATGNNCQEVANAFGYARVAADSSFWSASSGGQIYNTSAIVFPIATGNWGVVTHFVLCNSGSYGGGNVIVYGALSAARNVLQYSEPKFNPGTLLVILD